jgi:predicted nucleic acid-binding protein
MTRLILLDSGPLGMAVHPNAEGLTQECQTWLNNLLERGEQIAIPEIADYEVRRELIRAGLTRSIRRLDILLTQLTYLPINTPTMRLASELWAEVRRAGKPTADSKALDGDVILAAQAISATTETTEVIIATTNVAHLSRFTTAYDWQSIN